MMAKKLIGHVDCPECGFPDAEVGDDKNGHPYRFCPDCEAQHFTRGKVKLVEALKKKMRPLTARETPLPGPAPAPSPAPAPAPAVVKKRATVFG